MLRVRPLPAPLGHRGVLQTVQAKPQTWQLPWSQRQRRQMAGLHGLAGLCAAAIPGASLVMGTRLHTAVCRHEIDVVGKNRPTCVIEILWDSIDAIQGDRSAKYGLVAWFCTCQDVNPWDSIRASLPDHINSQPKKSQSPSHPKDPKAL